MEQFLEKEMSKKERIFAIGQAQALCMKLIRSLGTYSQMIDSNEDADVMYGPISSSKISLDSLNQVLEKVF